MAGQAVPQVSGGQRGVHHLSASNHPAAHHHAHTPPHLCLSDALLPLVLASHNNNALLWMLGRVALEVGVKGQMQVLLLNGVGTLLVRVCKIHFPGAHAVLEASKLAYGAIATVGIVNPIIHRCSNHKICLPPICRQ